MAGQRRAPLRSKATGRGRLALGVAVLSVLAFGATVVVPSVFAPGGLFRPGTAQASDSAAILLSKLNAARQGQGLAPLASAGDLTAVAADRAQIMASSGTLTHTPDLGSRVCCWTWLAENVAYGGSVDVIHNAFMASAEHRANILYAGADDVGVAVVNANGTLYAAEVFRARSDTSSGGRATTASGASRSGTRTAPGSTATTATTAPAPGSTLTYTPGPSPAELARRELRQRIHSARTDLQRARHRAGPFDPVKAAVRFAGTLDRVSN